MNCVCFQRGLCPLWNPRRFVFAPRHYPPPLEPPGDYHVERKFILHDYIITVIGATLLSAMANILSPESWRKYISVITGFIIISCIAAPAAKLADADLFAGFDDFYEEKTDYEAVEKSIMTDRLTRGVEEEIEKRFLKEFKENVSVAAKLKINENGEIEGVEKIKISGSDGAYEKTKRLCEIYGINEDEVEYE